MAGSKARSVAGWVVCGVLAILFVLAGSGKVIGSEAMVKAFESFGYPPSFRLLIGAAELAGAAGLLVPALAQYAAAGLTLIMMGAVWTHLSVGQPFAMPLLVMFALGVVVWLRRPVSRQG